MQSKKGYTPDHEVAPQVTFSSFLAQKMFKDVQVILFSFLKLNKDLLSISFDFILWVPEIDSFFAELKSQGVSIIEEITLRGYGSKEFVFEDIDGHRILVGD